ncbi:hypothetical protein Pelo_1352 [Pelomyxa schiedti]|nr:hypothetical protein Pelo_1352 [Pelomyxa schiedti]
MSDPPLLGSDPPITTIFMGPSGVGTSALLATIFPVPTGTPFRPGKSTGTELTTTCERYTDVDGNMYIDAPALGVERQQQQAVLEALNQGGIFRVVFVVTLMSARVQPGDIAMMSLLHQAVPAIGSNYSIVINKASPAVMSASRDNKSAIQNKLQEGLPPTSYFYYFPFVQSWDSPNCDHRAFAGSADFRNFIQHAPAVAIPHGSISSFLPDGRESLVDALESTLWTERMNQSIMEQLLQELVAKIQRERAAALKKEYDLQLALFCATGDSKHSRRADEVKQEFEEETKNSNQRTETLRTAHELNKSHHVIVVNRGANMVSCHLTKTSDSTGEDSCFNIPKGGTHEWARNGPEMLTYSWQGTTPRQERTVHPGDVIWQECFAVHNFATPSGSPAPFPSGTGFPGLTTCEQYTDVGSNAAFHDTPAFGADRPQLHQGGIFQVVFAVTLRQTVIDVKREVVCGDVTATDRTIADLIHRSERVTNREDLTLTNYHETHEDM